MTEVELQNKYPGRPWYWYVAVLQVQAGSGPWWDLNDSDRELNLARYCKTEEERRLLGMWPFGTSKERGVYWRYRDASNDPFCPVI